MQPDPKGVCATANCSCGSDKFFLKIYSCGNERAHCVRCDQAWESPFRGEAQDAGGNQAVGEAGDESSNLVSAKPGEAYVGSLTTGLRDQAERIAARKFNEGK
jgi:hypothetical protein